MALPGIRRLLLLEAAMTAPASANVVASFIRDDFTMVLVANDGTFYRFAPDPLDNLVATTDPTVDDDSSAGYSVKSLWFNTVSTESFILLDATVGAAHWEKTTLTVDDLGSMAIQNSSAVAITGGTIAGVTISGGSGYVPSTVTPDRIYGTDNAGAQTQFPVTAPGKGMLAASSLGIISFQRVNADDSVTLRSAPNFRSDLGLGALATGNTSTDVPNASGVSGTTTTDALNALNTAISNANLTAISSLATTGLIARTGSGTMATRTITGTTNQISVSNGDGVSGNPTLSTPQDIHSGATPTYAGIIINGAISPQIDVDGTMTNNSGPQFCADMLLIATASASGSYNAQTGRNIMRPDVRSGVTNTGTLYSYRYFGRRNDVATDEGTLTAFSCLGLDYGHNNTAAVTPTTTTLHGLDLQPYIRTGTITTMYDLRIRAPLTGITPGTYWGISQESTTPNNQILGKTGFGLTLNTAPTAVVDIAASSTARASLRLRGAGSLPTTPNAGDMALVNDFSAYHGTALKMTLGGKIFEHFADAGNGTTVETDLYSDSVPASRLAVNGQGLRAVFGGIFANHATATRQLKVYFGGTVIFDGGALGVTAAADWDVKVNIIRDSSSSVRCTVTAAATNTTTAIKSTQVTKVTGLTLSNAQTFKITGQAAGVGAASNDIVAYLGTVEYLAAA